jgi:hypothetical protein
MAKIIQLKTGLVAGSEMSTRDLIKIVLDTIPPQGFSFQDLKTRLRIQAALEKSKSTVGAEGAGDLEETFELEDNDYENFRMLVTQSRWNVRDKFVYDFLAEHTK